MRIMIKKVEFCLQVRTVTGTNGDGWLKIFIVRTRAFDSCAPEVGRMALSVKGSDSCEGEQRNIVYGLNGN